MSSFTKVDRIVFDRFFSVAPVNGLMVAEHKKSEYENGDTVAEIFNTSFGRDVELALFGGFSNGISITINEAKEISTEDIEARGNEPISDMELLAKHPGILVYLTNRTVEGYRIDFYFIVTNHGILSAAIDLDSMSAAEAKSYRDMFASALPVSVSAGSKLQQEQPSPAEDIRTKGERLISTYQKKKSDILNEYQNSLNNLYFECNHSNVSEMYSVRSRFRMQVNSSGRSLCTCVREFSEEAEKLAKCGADVAFIKRTAQLIRDARSDVELEVDIDTSGYGDWNIKHSVPEDIKALGRKWEDILNNHPEVIAERKRQEHESAVKKLRASIADFKKQIADLEKEKASRANAAKKAKAAFEESEKTFDDLKRSAVEAVESFIRAHESDLEDAKKALASLEQQNKDANAELEKTFFLAIGKKKALREQIDTIGAAISANRSRIDECGRQINDAKKGLQEKLASMHKAHEDLCDRMKQTAAAEKSLPDEIGSATVKLKKAEAALEVKLQEKIG